jgi:hypothetical protein
LPLLDDEKENRMKTRGWILLSGLAALLAPCLRAVARERAAARTRARRRATPDVDEPVLHHENLLTYQALLDESLALTFPASDPICTTAALHCGHPLEAPGNAADWHLDPGSKIAGHPAS